MTAIPIITSDYNRRVSASAQLILRNRYFEKTPSLTPDGNSLIARPGLRKFLSKDSGPIRGIYSSPGTFNDDAFFVSNKTLYRVNSAGVVTTIGVVSTGTTTSVVMAATAEIGTTPPHLFICDGGPLHLFQDVGGLSTVATPDDVDVIGLAFINDYVIVVPKQNVGINGRFYWIEPGEITIDPLNFATAERSPDPVQGVVVFADKFWLLGSTTTEPWITTGDADFPMERYQGILFDRGSWEGTAIQVKDSLVLVEMDGAVFQIGGDIKRISNSDIEERIRKAIQS